MFVGVLWWFVIIVQFRCWCGLSLKIFMCVNEMLWLQLQWFESRCCDEMLDESSMNVTGLYGLEKSLIRAASNQQELLRLV